mmetsp:Transcript_17037/g.17717  ORF Transcript_17037/g.17717 Transcript_17037/m.17717 type:complete len:224 (+) Transcript_17037:10-681(+)
MEPVEPVPYRITKDDGTSGPSSKDYTGKAEVVYPNSDTYNGDFKDGVKEGHGIYNFINGDKYTGDWKNNLQDGIGKTEYAKGGRYYGHYVEGKRSGEGVYNFINGDIYSGSWRYNQKHGKGTYIVNSCKLEGNNYMKIVGNWENGEILSGKWIYPNGTYYEGLFEKNLPKGDGSWSFTNRNVNTGEYKHSEARVGNSGEISTKLTWSPKEEVFDPRIHLISGK